MPAQSIDPGIDKGREQPAVEGDAHRDAREERGDELDPAHQAAGTLTARVSPSESPDNRLDLRRGRHVSLLFSALATALTMMSLYAAGP